MGSDDHWIHPGREGAAVKIRAQLDIEVSIDASDRDEALKKFRAGLEVYTNGEIRVEKSTLRAFVVMPTVTK